MVLLYGVCCLYGATIWCFDMRLLYGACTVILYDACVLLPYGACMLLVCCLYGASYGACMVLLYGACMLFVYSLYGATISSVIWCFYMVLVW